MPEEVVRDAFAFHAGEMFGRDTALTAFCGEECHTVGAEPHALLRELASRFHEPRSVPWDDVEQLLAAARAAAGASRGEGDETSETSALRLETSGVSKLLLAAPDAATIETWRPRWEALLGSRASVTQAVPTMLEVLPVGHDKTTGFEALASRLARESGLAFRSGAETSDDARAVSNDVFQRFGRKETDASNELRGSAPFAPLRASRSATARTTGDAPRRRRRRRAGQRVRGDETRGGPRDGRDERAGRGRGGDSEVRVVTTGNSDVATGSRFGAKRARDERCTTRVPVRIMTMNIELLYRACLACLACLEYA